MIVSLVMSAGLLAAAAVAGTASAGEIVELLGPGSARDISRPRELLRSDPKLASARPAHLQETPVHIVARFGPVEVVELLIRPTDTASSPSRLGAMMNEDQLIAAIRQRASKLTARTDFADRRRRELRTPESDDVIEAARAQVKAFEQDPIANAVLMSAAAEHSAGHTLSHQQCPRRERRQ